MISPRQRHRLRSTTDRGGARRKPWWIFRAFRRSEAAIAVDTIARALKADRVVELSGAEQARSAAYLITVEGAALHLARLRERAQDFDPEVRDRLIAGTTGSWRLGRAGAKIPP